MMLHKEYHAWELFSHKEQVWVMLKQVIWTLLISSEAFTSWKDGRFMWRYVHIFHLPLTEHKLSRGMSHSTPGPLFLTFLSPAMLLFCFFSVVLLIPMTILCLAGNRNYTTLQIIFQPTNCSTFLAPIPPLLQIFAFLEILNPLTPLIPHFHQHLLSFTS